MNQHYTKFLMITSAIALGAAGLGLTFFPDEVAQYFAFPDNGKIVFQLMGALYFGFAFLNWMAKGSVIGGIYQKPLVVGNLSHFMVGGLALLKFGWLRGGIIPILIVTCVYIFFAVCFGYLFFNNPVRERNSKL